MRATPNSEKPLDEEGATPVPKPEPHRTYPDQIGPETKPRAKPFTGGYYWLPTPGPKGITWSVMTCRDLGCGRDAGHDADLWPRLMVPLAEAWGKNLKLLRRRIALSYTGLPRGRVTRPDGFFLVLHGEDSPVPEWAGLVIAGFRLSGRRLRFLFDQHETMLPGHPRAVEASLGLRLYETGR